MKKAVVSLALAAVLGLSIQANAMNLEGEEKAFSPIYKATDTAVQKTLTKMGTKFTVDSDGDLIYKMDDTGWKVYVIFNHTSAEKVWNIQVVASFGTKKSRYDELVDYSNTWNSEKKHPKLSMKDSDTLRAVFNYPVQYGFNPDEFEDNVITVFEDALKIVGEETSAMRR